MQRCCKRVSVERRSWKLPVVGLRGLRARSSERSGVRNGRERARQWWRDDFPGGPQPGRLVVPAGVGGDTKVLIFLSDGFNAGGDISGPLATLQGLGVT